jgi:hemolysin III
MGPTSSSDTPALLKPVLRGRFHQIALLLAIPAGIILIAQARSGGARAAVTIYSLSLVAVFGTSAAYHRLDWSPTWHRRMRTLDHSMIFLLIAGTGTAFAALALRGSWRVSFLVVLWAGAVLGVTFKLVRIDGFTRLGGFLYIALGWVGIATAPQAIREADVFPLILIAIGGVMYTVGAVIFYRKRPDPKPLVFGYHELWHAFVVAASACHYAGITLLLRTTA